MADKLTLPEDFDKELFATEESLKVIAKRFDSAVGNLSSVYIQPLYTAIYLQARELTTFHKLEWYIKNNSLDGEVLTALFDELNILRAEVKALEKAKV